MILYQKNNVLKFTNQQQKLQCITSTGKLLKFKQMEAKSNVILLENSPQNSFPQFHYRHMEL